MTASKYLTRDAGMQKLVSAVDKGGTVGQSGAIPALDAKGKIDISMIPTDSLMTNTTVVLLGEDVKAGDYVNFYDDAGTATARKADASKGYAAHGYVQEDGVKGAMLTTVVSGMNVSAGLTCGVRYFLGTAGTTTSTPTENPGDIIQFLGVAVPATGGKVGIQFEYDDVIQC